ncbi:MAG: PAS domain S-box protein [Rhodospirillaceae bacterium]|nr:PAS domain S-box protein [Rhodospirillaceae bacterium]
MAVRNTPSSVGSSAESSLAELLDSLVCECRGGVVTAINPAGRKLLGYHGRGSPVGRRFVDHVAPPWTKKLARSLKPLTMGRGPHVVTLIGYDGRAVPCEVTAKAAKGAGSRIMIVARASTAAADRARHVVGTDRALRRMFDDGAEAIVLVDDTGVIAANVAATATLAIADIRDAIGRPFAEFVHGDYAAHFRRGLKDLARLNGAGAPELVKLKDTQGRIIDAEIWVRGLGKAHGAPFAVAIRDATRRIMGVENLMAGGRRLQAIVDAVADGVISVDERGLVQSVNAAVRALFGFTPKQLIGKPLTKILPQWTDEKGVIVTRSALGQDSIEFPAALLGKTRNVTGTRADKTSFPAEITVTTMQHGQGSLFTVVVRDASARLAAEQAQQTYAKKLAADVEARTQEVRALSRQTRQILESTSDGIIAVGLDGKISTANPAAGELFDRAATAMTGLPIERVFLYGSGHVRAGQPVPILAQLREGPFQTDIEASLARTDGASFDAAYVISPITENRQTLGYVLTVRDITERKKIAAEQRVAAAVFEHSSEGLLVADARGRVAKINPGFARITGYGAADVVGKAMAEVLFADPKQHRAAMDALAKAAQTEWEQWTTDKAGKRQAWRVALSVVRDDASKVQQYAAIVSDVTTRKQEEERVLYQANYDQLTGLPNRTLFNDRLQRVVLEGRRGKTNVGLMFIDLDGFKAINDTLGHDSGDLLLKETAVRLNKSVRESDTVARLGGDEFTVIMPLLDSLDGAKLVASRILASLTQPFDLAGKEGRVSASIGISIFPAQAGDAQQLLHNADVAMYHAKRHGKANYQIWRPELEADAEARY